MIRVLHLVSSMNCGGTENMIMSLYKNIDREKIQFDFLVNTKEKCFFDDEIRSLGGKIHYIPRWNGINSFGYIKKLNHFFKAHPEYKIIHGHIASNSAIYLSIAKKRGIFSISHSHNVKGSGKSLKDFIFKLTTFFQRYMSDYMLACSEAAGIARFGKNVLSKNNFKVLSNAIDLDKYHCNDEIKNKTKELYNLKDNFIIGHIGRFIAAKNHNFILEVFNEITLINPKSTLILAGDGPLEAEIKKKASQLGIEDKIIYTGVVSDLNSILNVMDVFLFPSLHEGLGIAAIEAQAMGIPCFINEKLPNNLDINPNVYRLSLEGPPKKWAQFIIDNAQNKIGASTACGNIKKAGYDIKDTSEYIEKFYLNIRERENIK